MGYNENKAIIENNRARYLSAIKQLPVDRHSPSYYFANEHGDFVRSFDPDGKVCVNGLALLGLGISNLDGVSEIREAIDTFLGYEPGTARRIDELNAIHTLSYLQEYIELDVMADEGNFSRSVYETIPEIPKGFSFENADPFTWYYCPHCGKWLFPIKATTTTRYDGVQRSMLDGRIIRLENGETRHMGGRIYDYYLEKNGLTPPDEVSVSWICAECRQELPERMSNELNEARCLEKGY